MRIDSPIKDHLRRQVFVPNKSVECFAETIIDLSKELKRGTLDFAWIDLCADFARLVLKQQDDTIEQQEIIRERLYSRAMWIKRDHPNDDYRRGYADALIDAGKLLERKGHGDLKQPAP